MGQEDQGHPEQVLLFDGKSAVVTPGLRCKEHSFNPAFENHGTVVTVEGSVLLLCCQENRTVTLCLGPVGPLGCDVEGAYRLEFTKGSKG